jgi:haloalkane dehalogenase
MYKLLKASISAAAGVVLTITLGCAAPNASSDQYTAYVDSFAKSNQFTEHQLTRKDGHTINAREFSLQFKGTAPTIVMMHGFPDNQQLYDLLIPLLAKNRHVITFDFLGWGKSQSPAGKTYPVSVQTEDIRTVVAELKLDLIDLVVHDLSGQSGIDWAIENAPKVGKLVLLNTYYMPMETLKAPDAIEFYSKPGWLRDLAKWGATKSPARFESGVASQIGKFMSNGEIRDQFVPIITHSAAYMRPAFFSSVSYLWGELDARVKEIPKMRSFDKSVQIIFGADDPFLNAGVAAEFGRVFGKSQVSMIKDAGHYVQLDNAPAVANLILIR